MMRGGIRQLCMLSVLCGAAMSLCPEGSVRKIMRVLCTAVLMTALLSPLKEMNMSKFALETARLRELEAGMAEKGSEAGERLNRLVIEQQYETYIMDKAADLGLEVTDADVGVQWSSEGFWVPYSAEIACSGSREACGKLKSEIEAELGIPKERQSWSGDE